MDMLSMIGRELNMEELFILTGIVSLAAGIGLGLLVEWLFERARRKNKESTEQ